MIKEKGTGEMYASKAAMKKHEKAEGPAMQKKEKAMMKKTKAKKASPLKEAGGIKVVPRNLNDRQLKRVQRINETSRERADKVANRISNRRNARGAENPRLVSPLKQGVSALPPNKKTQYKTAEKTVARGVAKRTPILMKKSC